VTALVLISLPGCTSAFGRKTLVASVYPLAYAAEGMAGPDWEVIDLTPPGAEAHDLELSLEDRSAIEDADLVVYLGDIGFQPQVEAAVEEADGQVVDLSVDLEVRPGVIDPHVWLAPSSFRTIVNVIGQELCPSDDPCSAEEQQKREAFGARLDRLDRSYFTGLQRCRYETLVVSHEAFAHLEEIHGIRQFGLSGSSPEAEPSVERLSEARALIAEGEAGAVFYEEHEEAREIAETFAADAGVPALPLATLESRPVEGDYISVMEENLASLREGLECE